MSGKSECCIFKQHSNFLPIIVSFVVVRTVLHGTWCFRLPFTCMFWCLAGLESPTKLVLIFPLLPPPPDGPGLGPTGVTGRGAPTVAAANRLRTFILVSCSACCCCCCCSLLLLLFLDLLFELTLLLFPLLLLLWFELVGSCGEGSPTAGIIMLRSSINRGRTRK